MAENEEYKPVGRRERKPDDDDKRGSSLVEAALPPTTVNAKAGAAAAAAAAVEREQPSDSALVGRALSGDEAAFEVLLERYRALTCLVAYRQLGAEEGVEDVAQEAFFRAFVHLSELDDPSRFKTWLLRIAANLALDHLRRRRPRELSLEREEVRATAENAGHGTETNPTGLSAAELRNRIVEAVYSLPPNYQLPAVLRWLEGLPYREISLRLGMREDTLRKRIYRANRMLRHKLRDLWPGNDD